MAGEQVSAEPGHGAHAPEPAGHELLARARAARERLVVMLGDGT